MLKKFFATGVVLAATSGAMLLGAPAHADQIGNNPGSVLSGTQVNVPINTAVSTCGNHIPVVSASVPVLSPNTCEGNATATQAGN